MIGRHRTAHLAIGTVLVIWTLIPIYHLLSMALTPTAQSFSGRIWPEKPSLQNLTLVVTQGHHFLEHFWLQLWNSFLVAVCVVALVLAVATVTSFAISRLRVRGGSLVTDIAMFTYLIPAAFLCVPLYRTMTAYGLINTLPALIISIVSFATPYAILVMKQAADKLPLELDEAARMDGASALQLFHLVYLPLMAPTLVAMGTYSFLLAWNEYLYALIMLATPQQLTVPVAAGHFLSSDDAPWNLLMATGVVYALPPVVIYYAFRRYMVSGLTAGAVKT